ncbi:TPA: N-6 DNA methylase, partial [Escherichia coli]|nr:N-6 DNA methylase [Escherichia coli]
IFGQEMDNATSALARMNMILHNNATAKIWKGNTISDPQWKEANGQLKTFDFAVANPPFSNKNWTNGINPKEDEFDRFSWGIPPEKNGDYAFLLHIIKSLKSTGKGAVILPHGVLFRGNAEARIRENLIKQG